MKPGTTSRANQVIFITMKEMEGLVTQLIDLGALCEKNKSYLIASRGKKSQAVYSWAFDRALKLFGDRKSSCLTKQ
jgi:hypothetical protein